MIEIESITEDSLYPKNYLTKYTIKGRFEIEAYGLDEELEEAIAIAVREALNKYYADTDSTG